MQTRIAIEAELLQANNALRAARNNMESFRFQARNCSTGSEDRVKLENTAGWFEEQANKELDRIFRLERALNS